MSSSLFARQEKTISSVPSLVILILLGALSLQLVLHANLPEKSLRTKDLPEPASLSILKLYAFGDPVALSKFDMLWLQSYDNQPGVSVSFKDLNYQILSTWLSRILALDPLSQYPLLSAGRVYGHVNDKDRQRVMIELIKKEFIKDPNRRWRWMAHAVYIAKHQIKDLDLALSLAKELTKYATSAPGWARQMEVYILDDMGESEAAKVLIGGLLESGNITDENELRFLLYRMKLIEERESEVTDPTAR